MEAEEVDEEFDGRDEAIHLIQVRGDKIAVSVVSLCATPTDMDR